MTIQRFAALQGGARLLFDPSRAGGIVDRIEPCPGYGRYLYPRIVIYFL